MHASTNRIGLALSGGGFRASLYHLGLVRFLRDAGLLSQVSHITSVSGGSVLAAHLALNWSRYNGSPSDFEEAASELLSFVRLDVRYRIVRRCDTISLTPFLEFPATYQVTGRQCQIDRQSGGMATLRIRWGIA